MDTDPHAPEASTDTSTGLVCSVLEDDGAIARIAAPWRALLGESDTDEPMMSPTWAGAWWEVFGGVGGRALRVGLVRDAGRLVGLAPLVARTHWYGGALPFRRLELVGTGEGERDEVCSEYVGVIAARGAAARVADAVADVLVRGQFGRFDELCLTAMNGATPMPEALAAALARRGLDVTMQPEAEAAIVVLQPSWKEWLAALPGRRRYTVTRSLRDFERWAAGTARVEVVTTEAELARARDALIALHEARWGRSRAGHGAFLSDRFREFHERVMPRLLAEGALDLSVLSAHGAPVGALYSMRWAGRVAYYQSGRRVDLPDDVRPGFVLHAHAIRRAIEAGCREYDLLGGSSRFKRTLAQASRTLVRLRATRPGPLEATRRIATRELRRARSLVAGLRGAPEGPAHDDDGD